MKATLTAPRWLGRVHAHIRLNPSSCSVTLDASEQAMSKNDLLCVAQFILDVHANMPDDESDTRPMTEMEMRKCVEWKG